MNTTLIERLAAGLNKQKIPYKADEKMAPHTSFCIGGAADIYCMPQSASQLTQAIALAREAGVLFYILGNGSNIVFSDEGYRGMVLHPEGELCEIRVQGNTITAGAGAALGDVCKAAQRAGLSGLEFAYGIPGSVGGAVYMNAGAFDGEMRQVVQAARCIDENGEEHHLPVDRLQMGYRTSLFHHRPLYITEVHFALQPAAPEAIADAMQKNMQARKDKQPLDMPSAGSAFKRPEGAYAGQLIDNCGLRGFRMGNAAISEKHCGFIVNLGGATCRDVLDLAEHVANTVEKETGIRLEKEIRVVPTGG